MDFASRFVFVLPATFFAVLIVASAVVQAAWWVGAGRIAPVAPARRAALVLALRLLPWAAGLASAILLAAPAFHFYEPRRPEDVSILVQGLAFGGCAVLAGTAARIAWSLILTARVWRRWRSQAPCLVLPESPVPVRVVKSEFPIVALIGLARPVIVLTQQVADGCPQDTLRAMLDHECAHLRRRDNFWRLLMHAPCDPVAWVPLGRRLSRAWHVASEQAADDLVPDRIALAEGLVWAARRAARNWPPMLAVSALDGTRDIEERVRRLLRDSPAAGPRGHAALRWSLGTAGAAVCGLAFAGSDVWRQTHELIEFAVNGLR